MDPPKSRHSYQLLESEVAEQAESCPPTPMLPEKWKPAMACLKPKAEKRNPPALKAAGGKPNPETTLPTASHKKGTETGTPLEAKPVLWMRDGSRRL